MASTMFVVVIFIFLISIHNTFPRPIDVVAEYAKVNNELELIDKTLEQVNVLKKMLVAERLAHQHAEIISEKDKEIGILQAEKNTVIKLANKIAVLPALKTKLDWYEYLWYTGGKNSEDFQQIMLEPIPWKLDEHTKGNMVAHAKKWDAILTSSPHPGAITLKEKLSKIFPTLKTGHISRFFGLLYARSDNALDGPVGQEGLRILGGTDAMIEALKSWNAVDDPSLIDVLRAFQEVTTTSFTTSKPG